MEISADILKNKYKGCLLGLAIGDAIGTTVEFKPKGSFPPITSMEGGGVFGLKAGQWTDDTSMALCLAQSLIERNGFDANDQMTKYLKWQEEGYMSSNGRCFDIGNTVAAALDRFKKTGNPYSGSTQERSAGNGSIMRIAPIPMYFLNNKNIYKQAVNSSKTTHTHPDCISACVALAQMIKDALLGEQKSYILNHSINFDLSYNIKK